MSCACKYPAFLVSEICQFWYLEYVNSASGMSHKQLCVLRGAYTTVLASRMQHDCAICWGCYVHCLSIKCLYRFVEGACFRLLTSIHQDTRQMSCYRAGTSHSLTKLSIQYQHAFMCACCMPQTTFKSILSINLVF